MNPLKKLAGQTAIYGLSTIVGRLLNYLLVPLYTYRFADPRDFGVVTEFYAYASFLNVVLTYGMETALFNFSAKSGLDSKVYSTALFSLLASSGLFLIGMGWGAGPIAELLRYPGHSDYVLWMAWIIGLDALSAIPFARLREQQRAKRFALLKTLNILINIGANLFFIGLCKGVYETGAAGWLEWAGRLYDPDVGIGYVFIANLIASAATVALLLPEFLAARARPDFELWRKMLVYALPLLVAGLAGMVNETLDRILLKYLSPAESAMEQLGIYGACYKISILMSIFIQAFRYAAEPFFFSHYKQSDARELYALVMRWFVIACSFIFLGVMANIAWVQYFVGANYRAGLDVVPILLLANLCLGVFFNLSIWYKLTEQTRFGTYLTLWGAGVTLVLNYYWIPRIGYLGSAWATLACYASMAALSYWLGQKFYPVRYDLKRMIAYPLLALGIYLGAANIEGWVPWAELAAKNGLLLLFAGLVFLSERKKTGGFAPRLSGSGKPRLTRLLRLVSRHPLGFILGFMVLVGLSSLLAYVYRVSYELSLIFGSGAFMLSLSALVLAARLAGRQKEQLNQRESDLQSEIERHKQTAQTLEKTESRCRQAQEQLRLAASVFESSHEGIMVTDANHRILKVNAGFSLITGYRAEEVIGFTPRFLHSDKHSEQYFDDLNGELKASGHWEGELWSRRKDGAYFTEWLSICAVTDDEGRVTHYVGILSDITERKLSEEKIFHMAQYDALTGLPNRILLQDRLEVLLAHIDPSRDGFLAVLFIDLDDFKLINDSLGHDYGDILLKNIAKRLSDNLRKDDTVARLGGDEFVVLLKDFAHREQVATVAKKLVETVAKPVVVNEMEMRVTCSIGISIFPEDGKTPIELMKNADTAMYHAKAKGRNNYQYFDLALNEAVHRRLILENSLRHALENRELQLYYQPQIELSSGEIAGCEAIIYWKHPEWGYISPAEFMSVAEESGLSLPLGDWVLRTALRQIRRWQDLDLLFAPVSFNLSPAQFAQENLCQRIMAALEQADVEPCYLELELTENLAMKDINKTTKLLHEFRDLGVRLAISHFGIGYSSLSFLKRLRIDKLKIDRSFVSDLDKNTEGQEIVYAIIQLAYSLRIEIAAEGVDTIGQLEQLQRLRCQIAQGMVFTPAIPAGQFTALLEACKPESFLKKSEAPQ